jgi:hypothetical protein
MKKFIITTAIFMVLPIVSLAAFQTPASQTPVQPMPENTAPNLSGNANTPGMNITKANNKPWSRSEKPGRQMKMPKLRKLRSREARLQPKPIYILSLL